MSMKLSTPYCVRFRLSALKGGQSEIHPEVAGTTPLRSFRKGSRAPVS